MNNIFTQLAIILGLSSALGFITYKFKLPLLIAYLVGGLLIALVGFFDVGTSAALSFLPEIGIAFVLFLVGMELDLRQIKSFGLPILVASFLQIVVTSVLGTFIVQSFGFKLIEAIYLGVGLSFSSTIVVVKLLQERKDLDSLYGKLSVGILLLEDLLAVVILVGLSAHVPSVWGLGLTQALPILSFVGKVVILLSFALILSRYILASLFKAVSGSPELLFLTALAWCFIYTSFAQMLGFSVLIGAFLAGVALANSPYHYQISGKVKPMRDFFTALFFVYLGTKVDFNLIQDTWPLILSFSGYAILVKPLIFLLILGMFGFRRHTLFHTAIGLSQISEFSLIIILVGLNERLLSAPTLTIIATSAVLSIIVSSIMISKSNYIYKFVSKGISIFEKKNPREITEEIKRELTDHVVVIGAHRVGGEIVRFLKRERVAQIVLDYNPHQVEVLLSQGIPVIYGDIEDPEIIEILNLPQAKLIISTSPDPIDNKALLENLKSWKLNIPIIVRAETVEEAQKLYIAGANFVIIPDILAGDALLDMLKDHLNDKNYFKERPKVEIEKLAHKVFAWD